MIEIILSGIRAEPQGSGRAMTIGGKARLIGTSSNKQGKRMRHYRNELGHEASRVLAIAGRAVPAFGKHIPVALEIAFFSCKPKSVAKSRLLPVVKPDCDKLIRATCDALTGIIYLDDSQVVEVTARKLYASFDGVRIVAKEVL